MGRGLAQSVSMWNKTATSLEVTTVSQCSSLYTHTRMHARLHAPTQVNQGPAPWILRMGSPFKETRQRESNNSGRRNSQMRCWRQGQEWMVISQGWKWAIAVRHSLNITPLIWFSHRVGFGCQTLTTCALKRICPPSSDTGYLHFYFPPPTKPTKGALKSRNSFCCHL